MVYFKINELARNTLSDYFETGHPGTNNQPMPTHHNCF